MERMSVMHVYQVSWRLKETIHRHDICEVFLALLMLRILMHRTVNQNQVGCKNKLSFMDEHLCGANFREISDSGLPSVDTLQPSRIAFSLVLISLSPQQSLKKKQEQEHKKIIGGFHTLKMTAASFTFLTLCTEDDILFYKFISPLKVEGEDMQLHLFCALWHGLCQS